MRDRQHLARQAQQYQEPDHGAPGLGLLIVAMVWILALIAALMIAVFRGAGG